MVWYQCVYKTVLPTINLSFRNCITVGEIADFFISIDSFGYSDIPYLLLHLCYLGLTMVQIEHVPMCKEPVIII